MKWINYQHLFYFWNIVHHGSVTEASRILRLAQPTISAQIKTLEEIMGEKLFLRSGRNLKLTEVGHLVFDYAEKIFSLGTELMDVISDGNIQLKKEFKIGISEVIPKTLVFKIIEPVFTNLNNYKVICLEDKTDKLLADLAIGALDLVISDREIPPHIKIKGYSHFLGSSTISLLGSTIHKNKYKKNFPKSLNNAPLLIPSSESILHNEILNWISNNQISPQILANFQDTALMKIAAKNKLGIIPVPKIISKEVCKEYNLEVIGEIKDIKERLYIITLERRLKNPLIVEISNQSLNLFDNR